ncbi:hypothetical protein [Hydrogenophaga aquatica]
MSNSSKSAESQVYVPRYYNPYAAVKTTLTQERIRQIETVAMRKVLRELVRRGIRKSDLIG